MMNIVRKQHIKLFIFNTGEQMIRLKKNLGHILLFFVFW